MQKPNILSFLRDDTQKAQIDRTRHVNRQLALSPDSPKEFQVKHAKVEEILFIKPIDQSLQQVYEQKRIKWYGKAMNLQNDYLISLRPNLSLMQDRKINESFQETESKVIREKSSKFRFTDRISNRSYEIESSGRYLDQKCAFYENYHNQAKHSFKIQNGMFEQFKNAQLLQKRGNQYENLLLKGNISNDTIKQRSYYRSNYKTKSFSQKSEEKQYTIFDSQNDYQNQLNLKIAKNSINQALESTNRRRTRSKF